MNPDKKKRLKRIFLVFGAFLSLVGLALGGYIWHLDAALNSSLKKTHTKALGTDIQKYSKSPNPVGQDNKSENILLVGSDSRYNHNGEGSVDKEPSANSDTMMVVHISADRKHTTVVSIPRDTLITNPPSCYIWSPKTRALTNELKQVSPTSMWQANAAYSVGGPQCAVKMAQRITGLTMTRYLEVDFNEFRDIINAVGGVKLNICKPMIDDNVGTIFATPGEYNVDGNTALKFARAREVQGDNASDLARIKRQQDLIKQVVKQKISPSLFLDPDKTQALFDAFGKNSYTDNITTSFLLDLGENLNRKNIVFLSMPTQPYPANRNRLQPLEPASTWLWTQLQQDKTVTKANLEAQEQQSLTSPSVATTGSSVSTASPSASTTPTATQNSIQSIPTASSSSSTSRTTSSSSTEDGSTCDFG